MKLEELEERIQILIEIHLMNLIKGERTESRIALLLASAMHKNLKKEKEDTTLAPNVYIIVLHPSKVTEWQSEPRVLRELANALHAAGNEAGYEFTSPPSVSIATDLNLLQKEVRVLASFSTDMLAETKGIIPEIQEPRSQEDFPDNAFLILNGTKIILLTQRVINIGRRLDNQVVIDDPRVSRNHAQLRVIRGRFVIFDLNSTGGTIVNGERINQSVLYPGDTISLAGVTLIFGQDLPTSRYRKGGIEPDSTHPGDRKTVFFSKWKDKPR